MPSRHRRAAPKVVTSAPSKRMLPAFGRSDPASTLSSVVLPAPFGPTIPTASSLPSVKSTSSSTTSAPKRFRMPLAARSGVMCSHSAAVRLQLRADRDLLVVDVLDDHALQLVLAPARRLQPLAREQRRRD